MLCHMDGSRIYMYNKSYFFFLFKLIFKSKNYILFRFVFKKRKKNLERRCNHCWIRFSDYDSRCMRKRFGKPIFRSINKLHAVHFGIHIVMPIFKTSIGGACETK